MDTLASPPIASILRHRFIEDMTVCGFSEKTRKGYIRIVVGFVAFLGRSPVTATAEDIRWCARSASDDQRRARRSHRE